MQVENVKKVSSLSPALAAVLGRCAAEPLRENFIKETDVGIACPGTDLCDGQVCIFQEILGEEQTVLLEDGFEGLARVPADVARQIVGIHVKGFRRGFRKFDSSINQKTLTGPIKPVFFCQF